MKNIVDLESLLKNDWTYPEYQIANTISRLQSMEPELLKAFESYLKLGIFPDKPAVFGLTPSAIAEAYSFKPPAVFLTMDWISRDPQKALDALVMEYHKPLPKIFNAKEYQEFIATQKIKST